MKQKFYDSENGLIGNVKEKVIAFATRLKKAGAGERILLILGKILKTVSVGFGVVSVVQLGKTIKDLTLEQKELGKDYKMFRETMGSSGANKFLGLTMWGKNLSLDIASADFAFKMVYAAISALLGYASEKFADALRARSRTGRNVASKHDTKPISTKSGVRYMAQKAKSICLSLKEIVSNRLNEDGFGKFAKTLMQCVGQMDLIAGGGVSISKMFSITNQMILKLRGIQASSNIKGEIKVLLGGLLQVLRGMLMVKVSEL